MSDEDLDAAPGERRRNCGQSVHVRMYGSDFSDRLRRSGLRVEEVVWREVFTAEQFGQNALCGDDDRFWICSTP